MTRYSLVCLLLGTFSCSQTMISKSALHAQEPAAPATMPGAPASDQSRQAKTPAVAPDTPVITITGFCESPPAEKSAVSKCKTVITRSQFEKVIDAVQPGMPGRARRGFALQYVDFLVMAQRAEQMGLDKGASYEEQMKIARIQILAKQLTKAIQEQVAQISDEDIDAYYQNNIVQIPNCGNGSDLYSEESTAAHEFRYKAYRCRETTARAGIRTNHEGGGRPSSHAGGCWRGVPQATSGSLPNCWN